MSASRSSSSLPRAAMRRKTPPNWSWSIMRMRPRQQQLLRRKRPMRPESGRTPKDNVCFAFEKGDAAAAKSAFEAAATTVSLQIYNNRVSPNSMEPRATVATVDPADGRLIVYTGSQNPHGIRPVLAGQRLRNSRNGNPRCQPGCRRRIRHEEQCVSRGCPGLPCCTSLTAAGALDLKPLGRPAERHPRARCAGGCRTGAGCGRQIHRIARPRPLRHGRLSVVGGAGGRLAGIAAVYRRLLHPGGLSFGDSLFHQHRDGRPLSRRRAAGSDPCHRTAGGSCSTRNRHRSCRVAPSQHADPGPAYPTPRPSGRPTTPAILRR